MLNDVYSISQLETLSNVLQATNKSGKSYPVAFYCVNAFGDTVRQKIDYVVNEFPYVRREYGYVGHCYECIVNGQSEYLFFSTSYPQMWYKLIPTSGREAKTPTDSIVSDVWHSYHRYLPQ